jgi:hypothetical protein
MSRTASGTSQTVGGLSDFLNEVILVSGNLNENKKAALLARLANDRYLIGVIAPAPNMARTNIGG